MAATPRATPTVTLPEKTKVIALKRDGKVRYITLTKTQFAGVSLILLIIGGMVSLLCLFFIYKLGQKEGEEAGARSLAEFRHLLKKRD
jgi:hypothetical protein